MTIDLFESVGLFTNTTISDNQREHQCLEPYILFLEFFLGTNTGLNNTCRSLGVLLGFLWGSLGVLMVEIFR